ncbi:hypothetical protein E2C01_073252 [Portunus trituberculatus]|uniref:Uncharacterized protein n=1 Tax=Portunus trituberculatus TaxID=210409 RepID=A0A5B7I9C5_PORTR|nr:hypothetical protein [Portunus trituberculatus]
MKIKNIYERRHETDTDGDTETTAVNTDTQTHTGKQCNVGRQELKGDIETADLNIVTQTQVNKALRETGAERDTEATERGVGVCITRDK